MSDQSRSSRIDFAMTCLPFETESLREALAIFLDTVVDDPVSGTPRKLGSFKWGVYAFFDYDGEPIYVGQTNEMLRTRIRRHITNRRTDAVAMNVLDPFEVCHVEIWPLPEFQARDKSDKLAKTHLDALECAIFHQCIELSAFKAVLNEKEPPTSNIVVTPPLSHRGSIVTEAVSQLRDHPDLRIARRASIMARLAQTIAERKVTVGLRRALLTQAKRLQWLAEQRYRHAVDDVDIDD